MEVTSALDDIARSVEGALERLDQQRPPPSRIATDPHETSEKIPKQEPSEMRPLEQRNGGDTTETDSESDDKPPVQQSTRPTRVSARQTEGRSPSPTPMTSPADPTPLRKQPVLFSGRIPKQTARHPRLLTSRVADAIAARSLPTACNMCSQAFTAKPTSTSGTVKCACSKRKVAPDAIADGEDPKCVRCRDCHKAGRRGLDKVRQAEAEKKRLANEKRKATIAAKKQQREEQEGDESGSDTAARSNQQKRRDQLTQRNFATFSRLILQDMGVGDVAHGLERLRHDRARRGRSLVDQSSDESVYENEWPQAKGRRRQTANAKPTKKAKTQQPNAPKKTATRGKRRAPPSPEIIEIDDSDE